MDTFTCISTCMVVCLALTASLVAVLVAEVLDHEDWCERHGSGSF